MTKTNGHGARCLQCSGTGRLFSLSMSSTDDVDCDACGGTGKDMRPRETPERCEILPLDDTRGSVPESGLCPHCGRGICVGCPLDDPDPRPILTLADGTTVRADEMWRDSYDAGCANAGALAYWCSPNAAWQGPMQRTWTEPEFVLRRSGMRRVYPPLDDTRSAIIREELAAQARRTMLRESIARLRPGDEFEITWTERAIVSVDDAPRTIERRCWARMTGTRPAPYPYRGLIVGRTTFGMIVTTHEAHVTDVRPEPNDAIRERWAGRAQ